MIANIGYESKYYSNSDGSGLISKCRLCQAKVYALDSGAKDVELLDESKYGELYLCRIDDEGNAYSTDGVNPDGRVLTSGKLYTSYKLGTRVELKYDSTNNVFKVRLYIAHGSEIITDDAFTVIPFGQVTASIKS